MTTDLIANASAFEILVFVSALVGAYLSRLNFLEALADYRALGGITNGRRMVALGRIQTELILGTVHGLYITTALVGFAHAAPPIVTPVGVVIQFIFLCSSWGMTTISFLSRRVGQYLMTHGLVNRDSTGRFVKATDSSGAEMVESEHEMAPRD